eukprot:scaffold21015_cov83-Skeletonema_dohrnii-CCMP3373.AAC.1
MLFILAPQPSRHECFTAKCCCDGRTMEGEADLNRSPHSSFDPLRSVASMSMGKSSRLGLAL